MPDERLGIRVVLGEVALDGSLQVDDRMEATAADALASERREEGLDRVEPGARGGREVEGPARVTLQPGSSLGVLVGGVVVDDGLDQLAGRDSAFDGVEGADEFLVTVALHAAADHRAVEYVQRREQGRGAMALVVVRHGPAAPRLERQPWLGTVERLDLALFVNRQHHGVRRRIDVEADHIGELLGKPWVARTLEAAQVVRLELMRLPD